MAMIETWFSQDLNEPVQVHQLDGNVFSQDNQGNLVGVNVFDGDEPATLSGSVSASVIRSDGSTVAVTGVLSGNSCYIILPAAAYAVPGILSIVIKLTGGGSTATLCAVVANVYQSATDATVDPGTIIPSIQALIDAINEAGASIPSDYSSLDDHVKNTEISINSGYKGNGVYTLSMKGIQTVQNGYMNENGVILPATSHIVKKIVDSTIRQIIIPQFATAAGVATVIVVRNNSVVKYFNFAGNTGENVINIPDIQFDTIYLNWWGGGTDSPYYNTVTLLSTYSNGELWGELREGIGVGSWFDCFGKTVTIDFENADYMVDGYLDGSAGMVGQGQLYKHLIIPAKYVKSISISGQSAPGVPYVYFYKDKNTAGSALIGVVASGTYTANIPLAGYIGINYFRTDGNTYAKQATVTFFDAHTIAGVPPYGNVVTEKLDFSGKTAVFVGDSITLGHTDGTHVTENNYPKLFSEKVGIASYQNKAVAGSAFVDGYNAIKTIPEQVAEIQTAPDFLFIAGGINDWQLGVIDYELDATIIELCDYIEGHFPTTRVVWILPINHAGWDVTHSALVNANRELQGYRNTIFEAIMKKYRYAYTIVDGSKFGFPSKDAPQSYINLMFGDTLHPTELGYRTLYVPGLLSALK